MSRRLLASRPARYVLAVTIAAVVTALGFAVQASAGPIGDGVDDGDVLGPGEVTVTMEIDHSRFTPDRLRVRAGTLVRFVVRNGDPIHHEIILGPPEVHASHATGTELLHPPIPGELSLGPNEDGMTFYVFDEPGTVDFACHLPGHAEYGMVGTVEVVR